MIYEPENLKNKRTMYEKKAKMLVTIELFLMGCNFICLCKHSNSLCGINNRLFNYYNWRNCYNYSFLFFIAFYVLINRGTSLFRKINNAIVREYNENKNGELFLEKIICNRRKKSYRYE